MEKEMDCYYNDKYFVVFFMFECYYKLCLYKFKWEFNCKQYMEKVYGWIYVWIKINGKKFGFSIVGGFIYFMF